MKLLYLAPMDVCFHQAKACKTFIRMPWSLYIQCPSDGCIYNTHTSVLASESSLAKLLSQQTCYEMNQILCNELMTLFYAPTSKLTQQRKPRILSASWVQFRCRPAGTVYRLESKDDSDYLAFKETTWSYSKFVYHSTFLCKSVPPLSQPIQICCMTMTNMQTEL